MSGFGGDSNQTYGNDSASVTDVINTGNGVQAALTVGTSAVEIKVGVSRLTGRKTVTLYNNSSSILYWGWTNAVTTSTGTIIHKKQEYVWDAGDAQAIFVIAGSAGNDTRITEG